MSRAEPNSVERRLVFAAMTTVDLIQIAESLPHPGDKAATTSSHIDVGGPAANAAITAAVLGSATSLLTVIGSGPLSGFARNVLEDHGVAVCEQGSAASLPVSSVWVDGRSGERTILATDNSNVDAAALPGPLLPDGTLAILLDGHYASITRAIASEAHEKGIPIVLDCGRWRPVYEDLLPLASDIIMCATFRPPELAGADQHTAVSSIHNTWQPELCAMTRGPRSILVGGEDRVAEIPVPAVDAVDTTGAGDVLHGAYLYHRYSAGLAAAEALERAAQLAAQSCAHLGVRPV